MLPSKTVRVSKSKIYKALEYYQERNNGTIYLDVDLSSYKEIEYLTILFALGYITRSGNDFVRTMNKSF